MNSVSIHSLLLLTLLAAEPDLIRLTTDGHLKQRPCWSPDGKQVVFARHQGSTIFLFLRDLMEQIAVPPGGTVFPAAKS